MNVYKRFIYMFTIVLFIFGLCKLTLAGKRILLKDVEVLTLYNGKMTTGRRSSPVAQLKCTGGSADCSFIPYSVQCYNRGSDGYDIQWECKTDMDNKYRFGHIQVSCEGYEYPDDPYILQGSCGLEYTIELTGEGYQRRSDHKGNSHHEYRYNDHRRRSSFSNYGFSFGDLVMLLIIGVIFYMVYSTCVSNRARHDYTIPPTAPPPQPDQPGFRSEYTAPGSDVPPPPYSPEPPGFKSEYTQGTPSGTSPGSGTSASSDSSNGYGFWSGAASGGLLGYLFGSRNSGSRYHHTPYNNGWYGSGSSYYPRTGSGWFGSSNWFGGGGSNYYSRPSSNFGYSSSRSSSSSSSGTRTASGMGGTSRR